MIELNGIQISDNNINTKKNVKIYVDEKQLDSKVGELSDLKTTNKSSIVNAINEIKNTTDTLQVDVNRIYSDFTIIPNTPTEQEFTYKKSDEGVIEKGVAVIDKVKGNSVVWNQLWQKEWASTATQSGITLTNNGDGSYTANGTANGDIDFYAFIVPVIDNHKYLIKGCPQGGSANTYSFRLSSIGYDYGEGKIGTNLQTQNIAYEFHFTNGVTCSNLVFRPQIIDLTQMFGAGNEPTTYKEFLQRKPKVADEYAYNEGTIVNNKVEKMITTGRNLFDSSTAINGKTIIDETGVEVINSLGWCSTFIPIIGGKSYFCKGVIAEGYAYGVHTYDKDKQRINQFSIPLNGKIFVTPINAKYIRIHGKYADTPANTAILNLSDASFNGQYAPYEKNELDLSWIKAIKDAEGVKLFEDGIKSAATAYDEVGKDKAVKRLGVKVFDGTENWKFANNIEGRLTNVCFLHMDDDFGASSKGDVVNMICSNYEQLVGYHSEESLLSYFNTVIYNTLNQLTIKDSTYTTSVETWKSHLADLYAQGNPLKVVYELAEPIEVEYDEKNLTYPVIAGGTEEAIASEPSTPMRASITYGSNTVATILSLINRVNELERKITN